MAPKKGGGGGGGGTTSSSSSSDCGSSSTYPCTAGLYQIYGSAFSQAELYGQVILFSIWTLALIAILIATLRTKAHALKLAITLFLLSFIFCVVRFALILAESDVPIGYRFESSIVVLLQRLGMVLLLAGVLSPDASKLYKFSFYPVLGLYAILNVAYLILDFFISAKAVNAFKDDWRWRLSDRDSGLTNTPYSLHALTTNGPYTLNPFYVESRMLDSSAEDGWQNQRSIQIKIGVAADFLALALAVFINIVAALSMLKRRKDNVRGSIWLLFAAAGLLLTTLFRVIVATHYVLNNWNVVADENRWLDWIVLFDYDDASYTYSSPGDIFLEGYRSTVTGFPVVQALFEPLGIVLAAAAMSIWWRKRKLNAQAAVYA